MLYYCLGGSLLAFFLCLFPVSAVPLHEALQETGWNTILSAKQASLNEETTTIVGDNRLSKGQGMALKANATAATEGERAKPDIVFEVKLPKADRYTLSSLA